MDILKERMFELLALTETKLKGKGEVLWFVVNVIFAGFQEMESAREGGGRSVECCVAQCNGKIRVR